MGSVYLTRHGRTYVNDLWGLLNTESREFLGRNPRQEVSPEILKRLLPDDEQRRDFIARNQLGEAGFYPFSLSLKGKEQAENLGRYLASRARIDRVVVPTKGSVMIYRNRQTADIVNSMCGESLAFHQSSDFTDLLGKEYSPAGDEENFERVVSELRGLDGRLLVLNNGILERIIGVAGGNLEFFNNCGLVVLDNSGKLAIAEDYLSNEELRERLSL